MVQAMCDGCFAHLSVNLIFALNSGMSRTVQPQESLMIPNRYNTSLHCNFQIPKGCNSLHHEVELGIVIEQAGKNISESSALEHVGGYVLALDMTARDFQDEAKKKGHPWTMAKGFDTSCPVSSFIPQEKVPDPHNINLWLKVGT